MIHVQYFSQVAVVPDMVQVISRGQCTLGLPLSLLLGHNRPHWRKRCSHCASLGRLLMQLQAYYTEEMGPFYHVKIIEYNIGITLVPSCVSQVNKLYRYDCLLHCAYQGSLQDAMEYPK